MNAKNEPLQDFLPTDARVDRPKPLRDQVRRSLIDLIVNYKLRPGQHLREIALADQLGVSRVPVREALLALAQEGWVDHVQDRGAFVHVPTRKEVMDTFDVRSLLESEAASIAAKTATASDIKALRSLCTVGRRAVRANDQESIVYANSQLHRSIVTVADNRELARVLDSIAERVNWYFSPIARTRGMDSWEEHDGIIDAIEAGDRELSGRLMGQHTRRTRGVYFGEHGNGDGTLSEADLDALHELQANDQVPG